MNSVRYSKRFDYLRLRLDFLWSSVNIQFIKQAKCVHYLLLFDFARLSDVLLPKQFYDHLLQMMCLIYLTEGQAVSYSTTIPQMKRLGENIVVRFPCLYTERHCVEVSHPAIHIADTVRDFGLSINYTTVNFENQLSE
jgi:hypothetical protein